MAWTDERIERLKTMWADGLTASQIAEQLGEVSRNAVIGKAHRLGLEARPSPVKAKAKAAPAPAMPAPEPTPEPTPAPVAAPAPTLAPAPASREPAKAAAPSPPPSAPKAPAPTATAAVAEKGSTMDEPAPAAGKDEAKVELRSVGPGGFLRQNPGETQLPIPPAPPRRLVPARPSDEVADKTSLLELNERICRWPIGHPGEPDFHFCGDAVNPGFPYCVQHCGNAYQAQMPRRDRKPPPPLPFGGPRVR